MTVSCRTDILPLLTRRLDRANPRSVMRARGTWRREVTEEVEP